LYPCFVEGCIVTCRSITGLEAHIEEHYMMKRSRVAPSLPTDSVHLQQFHFKCPYDNCGRRIER
jgi:hypothetical protein